jgi:hypothetical protein
MIVYLKHMKLVHIIVLIIHFNYHLNKMILLIILYKNLKIILQLNSIGLVIFINYLFLLNIFSLTKQRITLNSSNHHDERSTSYHVEPPKKVKFESVPNINASGEANQDSLIRHLQSRISDLRDDNMRLRDNQQSKSIISSYHEVNNCI